MAIGDSGRVVIDVDPSLKRRLHAVLAGRGKTLKAWFVAHAENLLLESEHPSLPFPKDGVAHSIEHGAQREAN